MTVTRQVSWISTLAIAAFLVAHLLPYQMYWAIDSFVGSPYTIMSMSNKQPLFRCILIVFYLLELVVVGVTSRMIDWRITRSTRAHWLQLHLSTCVILMSTASALILLHLKAVTFLSGYYNPVYIPIHFLVSAYVLLGVAVASEWWVRRREQ